MTQLAALFLVGAALVGSGLMAVLRRRSLIGMAVGFDVALGGLIVVATGLLGHSGANSSLLPVVVMVLAVIGAASAVLVAAVHVAMARASRSERGLEPW